MRITPVVVLAACAALAGFAPAVRAQDSASPALDPAVGSPIPFRVGLPSGWTVERDQEMLTAESKEAIVLVAATDLAAAGGVPAGDAEQRRSFTDVLLRSDLFALVTVALDGVDAGLRVTPAVREIRKLDGQRAAYLAGPCEEENIGPCRIEVYVTARDGILYLLMMVAREGAYAAHKPLFARVAGSLTLAPPPDGASAGG